MTIKVKYRRMQMKVPIKYMPKISAIGLFCCDKFEETPKQKVIDLSKFLKIYFNQGKAAHKSNCATRQV